MYVGSKGTLYLFYRVWYLREVASLVGYFGFPRSVGPTDCLLTRSREQEGNNFKRKAMWEISYKVIGYRGYRALQAPYLGSSLPLPP